MKRSSAEAESFTYKGFDILTLEQIVDQTYTIPEPQTAQEVIGFYAKQIANNLKLPTQFAALAPKVREFFEYSAFGQPVDLDDKAVIKAIGSNVAAFVVMREFETALKEHMVEQLQPDLRTPPRPLSDCPPFPYSRPTYGATKCIFNLVPCGNELERAFAKFLDHAPDVAAFAKLPDPFGFSIEYVDRASNMRYYYPDFVARLTNGDHWLVETKGLESVEVAFKDQAACLWCENATALAGVNWNYLKVPQADFVKLQPDEFSDLLALSSPC